MKIDKNTMTAIGVFSLGAAFGSLCGKLFGKKPEVNVVVDTHFDDDAKDLVFDGINWYDEDDYNDSYDEWD